MKTIIMDGNAVIVKLRYGINDSVPVEAFEKTVLQGFLNMVLNLGFMYKTNDFIFVWDSAVSNRKRREPSYKIKRKEKQKERTEAEIKIDIITKELMTKLHKHLLNEIGFTNSFKQRGHEGDDLIAKTVRDNIGDFVIVTSDQDMYQCLYGAEMYVLGKMKRYTSSDFIKEYGINPCRWGEVKAIAGCSSDCVIGVAGVGEKTAIKFLNKELNPKTKAYKTLITDESFEIIKKNRYLTVLPLGSTKPLKFKDNNFDMSLFLGVCSEYELDLFLGQKVDQWESFFMGQLGYGVASTGIRFTTRENRPTRWKTKRVYTRKKE